MQKKRLYRKKHPRLRFRYWRYLDYIHKNSGYNRHTITICLSEIIISEEE